MLDLQHNRPGADPELLLGGDANPCGGEGGLPNILIIFSEKPYEIKEILVRGGGAWALPLNPPLQTTSSPS